MSKSCSSARAQTLGSWILRLQYELLFYSPTPSRLANAQQLQSLQALALKVMFPLKLPNNVRPEDRRKYEWLFGRWSRDYGGDCISVAAILDASHTNRQHHGHTQATRWHGYTNSTGAEEHRPTKDIIKVFKTLNHLHTTLRTFKMAST